MTAVDSCLVRVDGPANYVLFSGTEEGPTRYEGTYSNEVPLRQDVENLENAGLFCWAYALESENLHYSTGQ